MNVKIILCAAKGKEYDKKGIEEKGRNCVKKPVWVWERLRFCPFVHGELQADINYNVPTSFSVVFPALDLVPTNLLLMLFSAETRV